MNHELSICEMKEYIYSIQADINTTNIHAFVKTNNISFTENVNGIFVNLSTLNNTLIKDLYSQIIVLQKNTSENNLNTIDLDKEFIVTQNKINSIDKNPPKSTNPPHPTKTLKQYKFTPLQKKILEFSLK
jgi:hypothetical protein